LNKIYQLVNKYLTVSTTSTNTYANIYKKNHLQRGFMGHKLHGTTFHCIDAIAALLLSILRVLKPIIKGTQEGGKLNKRYTTIASTKP